MQGSSFAFQAFQVLRHGAILFAAIVLTWLDPSKQIINQFELLMLFGGSLTFFWVTGLMDGFLLIYKGANLNDRGKVAFQAFLLALFFATICAFSIILFGNRFVELPPNSNSLIYFAVFIALDSASLLLAYLLLAEERQKALIGFGVFAAVGYAVALLIPVATGGGLEAALLWLFVLAIAKVLFLAIGMLQLPIHVNFQKDILYKLLRVGGPLAAVALLSQSAVYVDGYLVNQYFPLDFAEFRYGARELPFALILANSLSAVKSGEFAEGLKHAGIKDVTHTLKQSADRLIWILFPISLALMVFSGPIFGVVFDHRFEAAVPIFDIYLLLIIPRLVFPQVLVRGYHQTQMLTVAAFVELVLNVSLSLLFLQWWGMAGIAAATVVAFMIEKLLLIIYVKAFHLQGWASYSNIGLWLAWLIVLVGAFGLKYGLGFSF